VLRRRHLQEIRTLAPGHFERLSWPPERLRSEREARLRALVHDARERSPWHRERLADIDPGRLTENDLPELPVMTKDDLMGHFDEIVTDPRLTLEKVEAHLDGLAACGEPSYLLGRYHAVTSSGSSGRRVGVVYDWQGWADAWLGHVRHVLRGLMGASGPARHRPTAMAIVSGENPTHLSGSMPQTFSNTAAMVTRRFPVTLPLERIVTGLNEVHPDVLTGYPSVLHQLALEAGPVRSRSRRKPPSRWVSRSCRRSGRFWRGHGRHQCLTGGRPRRPARSAAPAAVDAACT
jgi:phenylacetate-CoA ligase